MILQSLATLVGVERAPTLDFSILRLMLHTYTHAKTFFDLEQPTMHTRAQEASSGSEESEKRRVEGGVHIQKPRERRDICTIQPYFCRLAHPTAPLLAAHVRSRDVDRRGLGSYQPRTPSIAGVARRRRERECSSAAAGAKENQQPHFASSPIVRILWQRFRPRLNLFPCVKIY